MSDYDKRHVTTASVIVYMRLLGTAYVVIIAYIANAMYVFYNLAILDIEYDTTTELWFAAVELVFYIHILKWKNEIDILNKIGINKMCSK